MPVAGSATSAAAGQPNLVEYARVYSKSVGIGQRLPGMRSHAWQAGDHTLRTCRGRRLPDRSRQSLVCATSSFAPPRTRVA